MKPRLIFFETSKIILNPRAPSQTACFSFVFCTLPRLLFFWIVISPAGSTSCLSFTQGATGAECCVLRSPYSQGLSLPENAFPQKSRSSFHYIRESAGCSVVTYSLRPYGLWPARLLCPRDCHFLFQGICPTQGLNPGLLHCRQILDPLSHQGSLVASPCLGGTCRLQRQLTHEEGSCGQARMIHEAGGWPCPSSCLPSVEACFAGVS